MKRLIVVSDMHIGSTVGLCSPTVTLDDGGTYRASRPQRDLWRCWEAFLDRVAQLEQPVLVLNGDIIEADVLRRSKQVITRNRASVMRIASEIINPLARLCSAVYLCRGTAAHTGLSAETEEQLARDLGCIPNSLTEAYSWYNLLLDVEGVRINIQHHGRGLGLNPSSSAVNYARQIVLGRTRRSMRLPHLVVRSHNHRWADSHNAEAVRVIYTPGWCLPTEHYYRTGTPEIGDIGALVIQCEDGHYTTEEIRYNILREDYQRL